jgi:hypothetical protein
MSLKAKKIPITGISAVIVLTAIVILTAACMGGIADL